MGVKNIMIYLYIYPTLLLVDLDVHKQIQRIKILVLKKVCGTNL